MCWVIGQFIAVGILNGFIHWDNQWSYRIPFAIQWVRRHLQHPLQCDVC